MFLTYMEPSEQSKATPMREKGMRMTDKNKYREATHPQTHSYILSKSVCSWPFSSEDCGHSNPTTVSNA